MSNLALFDNYINEHLSDVCSSNDDIYSCPPGEIKPYTLKRKQNFLRTNYTNVNNNGNNGNSLVIHHEKDRIYDYNQSRNYALDYKRYGQMISISSDDSPESKQIIDIFDLYKILKKNNKEKNKMSFFKKLRYLFNN